MGYVLPRFGILTPYPLHCGQNSLYEAFLRPDPLHGLHSGNWFSSPGSSPVPLHRPQTSLYEPHKFPFPLQCGHCFGSGKCDGPRPGILFSRIIRRTSIKSVRSLGLLTLAMLARSWKDLICGAGFCTGTATTNGGVFGATTCGMAGAFGGLVVGWICLGFACLTRTERIFSRTRQCMSWTHTATNIAASTKVQRNASWLSTSAMPFANLPHLAMSSEIPINPISPTRFIAYRKKVEPLMLRSSLHSHSLQLDGVRRSGYHAIVERAWTDVRQNEGRELTARGLSHYTPATASNKSSKLHSRSTTPASMEAGNHSRPLIASRVRYTKL